MKFLIFGFSVTAEPDGYVERCAAICENKRPGYEVMKVAIGGLQPDHARHLIEDVVATHHPDAIIMEIATAVYRLRARTDAQIADHTAGMEAVFALCKERGMRCGILDLPLAGIRDDDDWMAEVDESFSKIYNVPFRRVPLDETILRDNVHPNDEGKDYYARLLFGLVDEVNRTEHDFTALAPGRSFGAYPVKDLDISGGTFRQFSRAGFTVPMLELPEGRKIEIALPEPVTVTGMIMLMGPKSGYFQIMVGDAHDRMLCYDRHCYYQRVGGKPLIPRLTDHIAVTQTRELPREELLKGEKDLGPRVGGITHILYERRSG
ncbi:SGNH/GDSL hydrolase family protein [Salipiger abyssi]|uniref:SGNH/GDSL hydrolase family protein n=1 Tax=Salipiger abyssi TaxID=1250539 RepID=UPI004058DF9D